MQHRTAARSALACLAVAALPGQARVTQKPDGQWRSLFTAGASIASGNTDPKSASLGADIVKLTTTDKWSLTVYPNLRDTGDVRTVFDSGLSVAMTKQLALTATLSHRYGSRPGAGLGKNDTLFVTGLSLRFD